MSRSVISDLILYLLLLDRSSPLARSGFSLPLCLRVLCSPLRSLVLLSLSVSH